jgi:hypothetical protein
MRNWGERKCADKGEGEKGGKANEENLEREERE